MQRKFLKCLKSLLLVLPIVAASAQAQTTAAGPYYATPAWDQTLACTAPANCPRFIVLSNMNSKAVLDRESGLVWARSAFAESDNVWQTAVQNCDVAHWGTGRMGWRLPSVAELTSLLVVSPAPAVSAGLPAGHPFLVVSTYWTSSGDTQSGDPSRAKYVNVATGAVGATEKSTFLGVWCVRGGL